MFVPVGFLPLGAGGWWWRKVEWRGFCPDLELYSRGIVETGKGLVAFYEGDEGGGVGTYPAFVDLYCRCCLCILVGEARVVWCGVGWPSATLRGPQETY